MLVVVMDSRPFIVDRQKQEFRQYNQPNNTIAFQALEKVGKNYVLELLGNTVVIPQEILTEPLSDWAMFGINVKSQEEDWGIFLGDEKLARRLCGELPHIDLLGTDFTVDVRLGELRETAEPWKRIGLRDLDVSPDGESMRFLYDTVTHERVDVNGVLPEQVVLLEIPHEVMLDPVAVAREYELGDTGLLLQHPLQRDLAAVERPLSEAGILRQEVQKAGTRRGR